MGKVDFVDSLELRNRNIPILNGIAKDFSDRSFWYYTSLDGIYRIVGGESKGFFASNLDVMNDVDEANSHRDEKNIVHALCFCCTENEKIPMWYMYSGVAGKGASLGVTPAVMKEFINSLEKIYPVLQNNVEWDKPLKKDVDFDLECGWIFYQDHQNKNYFNYRGKKFEVSSFDEFSKNNYFIKKQFWLYENEFRIVIKNKSGKEYEKLYLPLPKEKIENLKVMFGPGFYNFDESRFVAPKHELLKYGINKIGNSNLQIKMDLIHKHFQNFVDEIPIEISKDKENNIATDICQKIKLSKRCGGKSI